MSWSRRFESVAALVMAISFGAVVLAASSAAAEPPDTSKVDEQSCRPCHASSRAVPTPWDALGLFPEYEQSVFAEGTRIPLDTTFLEWRVWQDVLPEDDGDRGKSCFRCHLGDAVGPVRSGEFGAPEMAELHRWLRVNPEWKEKTLGVWVDVDTYRSFVVATVKVLNYGSGHRVPVRGQIVLKVAADDAYGKPLEFVRGQTLPVRAGSKGPGFLYERTYADADGKPASPKDATQVLDDTRLHAGEHDEHHFYFLLPREAPRGARAWEVRAELVWRVDGKEFALEKASADSPR